MTAPPLFDLTGKIALVSGASRGIGAAIAKLLAAQGAHTIVSSRRLADCQAVVDRGIHAAVNGGQSGGDGKGWFAGEVRCQRQRLGA